MQSIPSRNWIYRSAYVRPRYRYGIFIMMVVAVIAGWRYGLYIWLDALILQEQATICQLQQQVAHQLILERHSDACVRQLPVLKNRCSQGMQCCIGTHCYNQSSYIFNEAQKSGLHVLGYHTQKEKKKSDWKQSHYITISFHGTCDQMALFLEALKKSKRLVQCTELSLQQSEDKKFNFSCKIQFIVATAP